MLIALLVGWTFLGFTTQVVCVVLGGVGFGPPLLRSEVAPRLVPQQGDGSVLVGVSAARPAGTR